MGEHLKSLFEGLQRNIYVIIRVIGVLIPLGKNAHIFIKNVLNFLKDICEVPKSISGMGEHLKSLLLKGPLKEYIGHNKIDWGLGSSWKNLYAFL